jgi:RNA polymerase sigma-70 factor (ECF subfamily)
LATQATLALQKERAAPAATVDGGAFLALYDRHLSRVYAYFRHRISDETVCEDLTAATFEQALAHLDQYTADRGPFAAWLFGIARNQANGHLRRTQRWRWLPLELAPRLVSTWMQPEDTVIHADTCQELVRHLQRLGPRQRDLIALKFAAGLSNKQIAILTGLTESNVGVILHRAIRQLRRWMQSCETNDEF